MHYFRSILLLIIILSVQSVFANEEMKHSDSKPCEKIVSACLNAGYTRENTTDKQFWQNCMKPIVLGQTVQGVEIDTMTTKACRMDKIAELKQELKELENISKK